jgi:tyrosinase
MSGVHGGGAILPWHRYAITLYEDVLISECGWQGGVPCKIGFQLSGEPFNKSLVDWNWFLDTKDGGGSFLKSPVFDKDTGFGGNGKKISLSGLFGLPGSAPGSSVLLQPGHSHSDSAVESLLSGFSTGGGCLLDGPFINRTVRIGPFGKMAPDNTHCLTRNLNPMIAEWSANKKTLSRILSAKTYAELSDRMSHAPPPPAEMTFKDLQDLFESPGDLHGVGHGGIGGEVSLEDWQW